MKIVLQRVSEASVSVEGKTVGSIGSGLLILFCAEKGDDASLVSHYASKAVDLRIFNDEAGKMNRSIRDTGGEVLVISQFTLAADVERGRRPGFERAAPRNWPRVFTINLWKKSANKIFAFLQACFAPIWPCIS